MEAPLWNANVKGIDSFLGIDIDSFQKFQIRPRNQNHDSLGIGINPVLVARMLGLFRASRNLRTGRRRAPHFCVTHPFKKRAIRGSHYGLQ